MRRFTSAAAIVGLTAVLAGPTAGAAGRRPEIGVRAVGRADTLTPTAPASTAPIRGLGAWAPGRVSSGPVGRHAVLGTVPAAGPR